MTLFTSYCTESVILLILLSVLLFIVLYNIVNLWDFEAPAQRTVEHRSPWNS